MTPPSPSSFPPQPLPLDLPESLHFDFGIYVELEDAPPPSPEALLRQARERAGEYADPQLARLIASYLRQEFMNLEVRPREALPEPPESHRAALGSGEEEERRFERATHVIALTAWDLFMYPLAGWWAGLMTARALARDFGGVILEARYGRLLRVDSLEDRFPKTPLPTARQFLFCPCSVGPDGLGWITTVGMRVFGLPELEICEAPPSILREATPFLGAVAYRLLREALAHAGQGPDRPRRIHLDPILELTAEDFAAAWETPRIADKSPVAEEENGGAPAWALDCALAPRQSKEEAGMIRVLPPPYHGGEMGEWLYEILAMMEDSSDPVIAVEKEDAQLAAAVAHARETWPAARQRFAEGLPAGRILYVKHGFPTPDGGSEHMWIVVNRIEQGRVTGQLANDPQWIETLQAGQTVDFGAEDISDWMVTDDEGIAEGGFTVRPLMEREKEE